MTSVLLAVLAFTAAPAPKDSLSVADWPQWRGTHRDGKSGETGLVLPKDGPKLVWQNEDIGIGYGQVAVVGERMYLIGGKDNNAGSAEFLVCLKTKSGEIIWKKDLGTSAGKFSTGWGGGPRSTPTVVNNHVYCLGATGDLVCFTAEDGKKVWSKNLVKDFGGRIPNWGYSESPLIDGEKCVVTPGNDTGMIALDAATGKTIWACKDFKDGAGYASIMAVEHGMDKLYVTQTMESALGVFAKDGKLAFKHGELGRRTAVIPTPVISGDYLFFTAGYGAGCETFRLAGEGSSTKADVLFSGVKSLSNHHGGVIGIGDHVFGHSDSGGWTCLAYKKNPPDVVWQSNKLRKGSISYADNHFFCYQEQDGECAVIKVSTDGWDEVCRFKIPKTSPTRPKSGRVWPHPVIAQGMLFLRDFEYLFAYDVKGK